MFLNAHKEYKPGTKLKLRFGFGDKEERGESPIRFCTVVKQYPHVVHLVFVLREGIMGSIAMTPWEIEQYKAR